MQTTGADGLVQRAVHRDQRAIARLISLAERGDFSHAAEVFRLAGRAHIVGITGVPGSGKSTLVRSLVRAARVGGLRVGVVAIDPSSPFGGGSILGDRIRMNDLSSDDGVFIRSMASGGLLGGLAQAAQDAVDVLDAAGYDLIFVETVGVGQDEVDIARAAHTVVVVSAPGLGDGVQALKSGILEIADIHAVSKADRPDAQRTVAELKDMLGYANAAHAQHHGEPVSAADAQPESGDAWPVAVIATSAEAGTGIEALLDQIAAHREHLQRSGTWQARVARMLEWRMLKIAEERVRRRFVAQRAAGSARLAAVLEQMQAHALHPAQAAAQWLEQPDAA